MAGAGPKGLWYSLCICIARDNDSDGRFLLTVPGPGQPRMWEGNDREQAQEEETHLLMPPSPPAPHVATAHGWSRVGVALRLPLRPNQPKTRAAVVVEGS